MIPGNDSGFHTSTESLFDRLCTVDGLMPGWERVLDRSPLPGSDGISVAEFSSGANGRLQVLAESLARAAYRPGTVRPFLLAKKNRDGFRRLGLLCVADRIVQSALGMVIGPILEHMFENSSHGYRPGRSVQSAARQISALYRDGYSHVVEADIRSYFDTVPHEPLLAILQRHFPDPRLIRLFRQWLSLSHEAERGLVQGAPISPLLANLYLDDLDEAFDGHGARIVRFADDFVILTRSRNKAERVLHELQGVLAERGLELHPGKSGITDFDHGFAFLGKRFLKSFVMDKGASLDQDDWDRDLAEAIPAATDLSVHTPMQSRQFRDNEFDRLEAIPSRPTNLPQPPPSGKQKVDGLRPLSPRTRTLHLVSNGKRLNARDSSFTIEEAGQEIWLCGANKIDRIDLGPNARFTEAALRFALETRTPVRWTDGYGRTVGHCDARPAANARRHLDQAEHIIDARKSLTLARDFVRGKIVNQGQVIKRWRNNNRIKTRDGDEERQRKTRVREIAEPLILQLRILAGRVDRKPGLSGLLALEGEASKKFLEMFRAALIGWTMGKRQRQPAPDAVNAVLNWLSHMLTRDVGIMIDRHGLHSGFSHLHACQDGRDSLAFDLMEEFRPPVVEAMALTLFNGVLSPEHFFCPSNEETRITSGGAKHIINNYEQWMTRERLSHPELQTKTSWRGLIEAQVMRYVRHVENGEPYIAYKVDI